MKKIECRHNNLYSYIQTTFVSLYTSTLYKADKSLIFEHSWVNDVRHIKTMLGRRNASQLSHVMYLLTLSKLYIRSGKLGHAIWDLG